MKLSPALEYEKLRQEADSWNKIFLHKDGKFFRAYEWSAWLIKTLVCSEEFQKQRGDVKILAANRYVTKKGEYVSVGFPLESLAKYMPSFGDVDFSTIEDYAEFTVTLPCEGDVTYEQLQKAFLDWKQSLPEKDTRGSQKPSHHPAHIDTEGGRVGIFQILSQVLSYPLESKTPADNYDFIAMLRRQLAALL